MLAIDGFIIWLGIGLFLINAGLLLAKGTNKTFAVFGMVLGLSPLFLYALRV